jgi:ABC-type Mn2+/Zn2+ transport system ATPase subunit
VSFEIHRGDFVAVVGPNGSGKTTLLRAMLGLLAPLNGRGRVRRAPAAFGYVPQRARLDPVFPLRTADVVRMGRYRQVGPVRRFRAADDAAVATALRQLGIEDLAARPYRDLSGGQQQRTLLARALAGEPDALVLDEPTNGMDLAAEAAIVATVARLAAAGRTVVFVTHQIGLLADVATRFLLLGDRGQMLVGDRATVLTSAALSAFYGAPIEVERVAGRTIVSAMTGAAGA